MTLQELVAIAINKSLFMDLQSYVGFCKRYLEFAEQGLQAVIVSQNENHYRFFQYKQDGDFNITRPINSRLMYGTADEHKIDNLLKVIEEARNIKECGGTRNHGARYLHCSAVHWSRVRRPAG